MSAADPIVRVKGETPLDEIHRKRMQHALWSLVKELMELHHPGIDFLLDRWSVALMPGNKVGIDYPPAFPQILEAELQAEKAQKQEVF